MLGIVEGLSDMCNEVAIEIT